MRRRRRRSKRSSRRTLAGCTCPGQAALPCLAAEAAHEQQSPLSHLAALLEAMVERAECRERRRLLNARFALLKRLEDFHFDDNPNVPQGQSPPSPKSPGPNMTLRGVGCDPAIRSTL